MHCSGLINIWHPHYNLKNKFCSHWSGNYVLISHCECIVQISVCIYLLHTGVSASGECQGELTELCRKEFMFSSASSLTHQHSCSFRLWFGSIQYMIYVCLSKRFITSKY